MTNSTQEQEAAARARCDAATKGPWSWEVGTAVIRAPDWDNHPVEVAQVNAGLPYHENSGKASEEAGANADFAAHARKDLPDALDENQRLRKELIEVWPHRALRCPCSERQRARDIDNPAPWQDCTCGLSEALYAHSL